MSLNPFSHIPPYQRVLPIPRAPKIDDWMFEAVKVMARTGCSLHQAAMEQGQKVTQEDCALILRRETFNQLLWEARHRYFNELGRDPNFTKDTAIGKLLALAQKLEEEGEHDKSAEVLFKIAKMTGWVGPESQVSVFGELSQRDLDAIRESVKPASKVQ